MTQWIVTQPLSWLCSDLGIICDVIIVIIIRSTSSNTKWWLYHSNSISRSPPRDKQQCATLRTTRVKLFLNASLQLLCFNLMKKRGKYPFNKHFSMARCSIKKLYDTRATVMKLQSFFKIRTLVFYVFDTQKLVMTLGQLAVFVSVGQMLKTCLQQTQRDQIKYSHFSYLHMCKLQWFSTLVLERGFTDIMTFYIT